MPVYLDALMAEIRQVAGILAQGLTVKTIYLGGGTPSYLPVEGLNALLKTCREVFLLQENAEISLEANPGTVNQAILLQLRKAGYNRISLGMQSAHPADLRLLEREHDTMDVIRAVQWAKQAGFSNVNLDLIFGVPGQTMQRWRETLRLAIGMKPKHLSLYGLTVEPGTRFRTWVESGRVEPPDDDLAADQYEYACELLAQAGFRHYEISNWALDENGVVAYCLHNLQYWRNLPYVGFGAGAHGFFFGMRIANVRAIPEYVARIKAKSPALYPGGSAAEQVDQVSTWNEMQETMMVGLRLLEEGVNDSRFEARFGTSLESAFRAPIEKLIRRGLIEWEGSSNQRRLRLSRRGWLLGNQVFSAFVGLPDLK